MSKLNEIVVCFRAAKQLDNDIGDLYAEVERKKIALCAVADRVKELAGICIVNFDDRLEKSEFKTLSSLVDAISDAENPEPSKE
jgi:hypothetical protein